MGPARVDILENDVWNESALDETEQRPSEVESSSTSETRLAASNDRPRDHLNRDPVVWAKPFRDHLGRQLRAEKGDVEDGLAIVVLVRSQAKVRKHVVGESLGDVATVQL